MGHILESTPEMGEYRVEVRRESFYLSGAPNFQWHRRSNEAIRLNQRRESDSGVQVLESERQPMQGTDAFSTRQVPVCFVGEREAFLIVELGDDGVDAWIDPLDLAEKGRHDFARTQFPYANPRRQFATAHETNFAGSRRGHNNTE